MKKIALCQKQKVETMLYWYVFLFIVLELTIFLRGNAKFVWGLELHPLEWWLYVGWLSSLCGLTSWWGLVDSMGVWKATIFCMVLSFTISFFLKWYFFYPPSWRNFLALCFCWSAVFISKDDHAVQMDTVIEEKE